MRNTIDITVLSTNAIESTIWSHTSNTPVYETVINTSSNFKTIEKALVQANIAHNVTHVECTGHKAYRVTYNKKVK